MTLDDILKNGNDDFRFRPDDGALRTRLVELVIANENEEFAESFSENSCDVVATISGNSFAEGILRCQVFSDLGERSLECRLAQLQQQELDDLQEQLSSLAESQPAAEAPLDAKNVVRKKFTVDLLNMLTIDEAAAQLNLSKQQLKSRIPCSDYSYIEVEGKIEIKEYYWSKDLVARLCEIRKNGAKTEDIKYFADECCHGDQGWAKDVLGMLTQKASATNRDNAAQKGAAKQSPAAAAPKSNFHRHNRNKPK
jgi:hypothetical protein